MNVALGVVVLAAGAASRYGAPKLALPVGGVPLVRRAALVSLSVDTNVVVVVGAHREIIEPLLADLRVTVAFNADWSSGMGCSLSFGIKRLREIAPNCRSVLIALADQVLVDEGDLERLLSAHNAALDRIAAASYDGVLGVPCLFPNEYFDELERLQGDVGARDILKRHIDAVVAVPMSRARFDIDTPDDYARVRAELNRSSS